MGLGHCSKVVSTVYASPDLPSCRRHQKAAAMAKQAGSHGKFTGNQNSFSTHHQMRQTTGAKRPAAKSVMPGHL